MKLTLRRIHYDNISLLKQVYKAGHERDRQRKENFPNSAHGSKMKSSRRRKRVEEAKKSKTHRRSKPSSSSSKFYFAGRSIIIDDAQERNLKLLFVLHGME